MEGAALHVDVYVSGNRFTSLNKPHNINYYLFVIIILLEMCNVRSRRDVAKCLLV